MNTATPHTPRNCATIGNFDGIHLGHRQVLLRLKEVAAARGMKTMVVTFDRHPAATACPERVPLQLMTLDEKVATLKAAKRLGLEVCCGGILGMGETPSELVEFAFALKEIAPDSIPVNVLHPIPGTPLGERPFLSEEEILTGIAVLRLVNPRTPLRFAGGRRDMSDATAARALYVGVSAGIAGPLLTTPGADFADDRQLALEAGYAVARAGR